MPPSGKKKLPLFPLKQRETELLGYYIRFSMRSLQWYAAGTRRKLCDSKAGLMFETYTVKEIMLNSQNGLENEKTFGLKLKTGNLSVAVLTSCYLCTL